MDEVVTTQWLWKLPPRRRRESRLLSPAEEGSCRTKGEENKTSTVPHQRDRVYHLLHVGTGCLGQAQSWGVTGSVFSPCAFLKSASNPFVRRYMYKCHY